MQGTPRALLFFAALGACRAATPASATLQSCNSSAFCPSATPFCLMYGMNYTLNAMRSDQSSQQNLFVTTDKDAELSFGEGVCVQCLHDCDCGINQYCGIDPDLNGRAYFPFMSLDTLPAISATKNFSKELRTALERFINNTKGLAGLPLRSKCMNYKVPSTTCAPVGLGASKQLWGPFNYVTGKGYNLSTSVSTTTTHTFTGIPFTTTMEDDFRIPRPLQSYRVNDPAKSSLITQDFYESGQFCGELGPDSAAMPRFVPAFYATLGGYAPLQSSPGVTISPSGFTQSSYPANHKDLSTGNNFNTAQYCSKVNQYSVSDAALELRNRNNLGTDAVQCGIVFSYTESYKGKDLYSVNFNSSAIAWQGICISGTCAICKNGERRCGESYGHPRGRAQLCVNGQWVEGDFGSAQSSAPNDIAYRQFSSTRDLYSSSLLTSSMQSQIVIAIFVALLLPVAAGIFAAVSRRPAGAAAGATI